MRLTQYLRDPRLIIHRVGRALYERRHPGEPWMAPGAIRFLEQHLRPDIVALEWGSGRSTKWFAARVQALTSVEHDKDWYERVRSELEAGSISNVDYRYVALDADKETGDIFFAPEHLPAYARVALEFPDGSLGFAAVDGAYRISCALQALPKLKPGGLLLVDDAEWFPTLRQGHVPDDWPVAFATPPGVSSTTIWRKPG